jgi:FkbM family methyltransferase
MDNLYHAQFGEDEWILKNVLDLPEGGVFVDVGAGNPIIGNNTWFFEQHGWTGLCIDGDPRTFGDLLKARKTCFFGVVAPYQGFVEFNLNPELSDLSGLISQNPEDKKLVSPCFKLDTILSLHGIWNIDLMSIDIEGSELDVLKAFDFAKRAPRLVICEYNTSGILKEEETIAFFTLLNYDLIHKTEANLIFRLKGAFNG